MKISTKGRYALRFLTDLAVRQGDGFVPLKDVAARQNISKKYLEQIVPLLTAADVVETNRGHTGGYRLKKGTEELSVARILKITEGGFAPVPCLEKSEDCARSATCPTLPVWTELYRRIDEYLESVTLRDLVEQSKA